MTTIYVTKYALSTGPFIADATLRNGMAIYRIGDSYDQYAHKGEYFLDKEDALADCERRRDAKLKSIEKQKAKLMAMTFGFIEDKS